MKYYAEYVMYYAKRFFNNDPAKTKADKVMYLVLNNVFQESMYKDTIKGFYQGTVANNGAFKIIKLYEKEVAQRRGLI